MTNVAARTLYRAYRVARPTCVFLLLTRRGRGTARPAPRNGVAPAERIPISSGVHIVVARFTLPLEPATLISNAGMP
jgi:hypothetical protein